MYKVVDFRPKLNHSLVRFFSRDIFRPRTPDTDDQNFMLKQEYVQFLLHCNVRNEFGIFSRGKYKNS